MKKWQIFLNFKFNDFLKNLCYIVIKLPRAERTMPALMFRPRKAMLLRVSPFEWVAMLVNWIPG